MDILKLIIDLHFIYSSVHFRLFIMNSQLKLSFRENTCGAIGCWAANKRAWEKIQTFHLLARWTLNSSEKISKKESSDLMFGWSLLMSSILRKLELKGFFLNLSIIDCFWLFRLFLINLTIFDYYVHFDKFWLISTISGHFDFFMTNKITDI